MTAEQFNTKWADHIPKGYYGLEFDIPQLTELIDKTVTGWVEVFPKMTIKQIKLKFGMARVYVSLDTERLPEHNQFTGDLEEKINKLLANQGGE